MEEGGGILYQCVALRLIFTSIAALASASMLPAFTLSKVPVYQLPFLFLPRVMEPPSRVMVRLPVTFTASVRAMVSFSLITALPFSATELTAAGDHGVELGFEVAAFDIDDVDIHIQAFFKPGQNFGLFVHVVVAGHQPGEDGLFFGHCRAHMGQTYHL